jgi:hypothetical protein
MEHKKELHAFVEACKTEGLDIPILFRAADEMAYFWELGTNSDTLNLYASLRGSFECRLPEEIGISDIMTGRFYNFTATILYSSIYNSIIYNIKENETKPEEWALLPKRYTDECELIARLDKHIPKNEKSRVVQNSMKPGYGQWCEFYSDLVRQKKLRWASIAEEMFPYVITTSENLEKKASAFKGGLCFVAGDIAKEPWQEQIIAYHAKNCHAESHEFALKKEKELARKLGKEEEHKKWRSKINIIP